MSRRGKNRRQVHGILLLDKPRGMTSNRALQRAKWLYNAAKAGHTGSLDPLATGLLPLCFGDGTKVSAFLLDADKTYEVRCRLGQKTDTGDAEGEIVERAPVPELTDAAIEQALSGLRGPITQIPPMYSALKHQGQRLYDLARKGVEVERKPRQVTIFRFETMPCDTGELAFRVHCSKGTYIRSLIEDFAAALGTVGHVSALRRTALGPFRQAVMITMDDLEATAEKGLEALDALLQGVDVGLAGAPSVHLDAEMAHFVRQGQAVWVPKAPDAEVIRLYDEQARFIGVGTLLDDGRIGPKRLMTQPE